MTEVSRVGYCNLCTSSCGAIYGIENDRIVSVRNNPEHPTGSAMCLKGKAASELVENPERLRHPMRRTNPKGSKDPGWMAITWDQALDEIASRLLTIKDQSGAHSVAFAITTPSGTPISDSSEWIERFVYSFGSPNICYATEICNWHKEIAHGFTYGCGMPAPDYIKSDLIILWGHNPANTWLAQAHAIGEARKAGARLIVIDPRETALARDADVWLRPRPGTDAALAMGLANGLVASGKFDHDFIRHWSNGALLVRQDNGTFLRGRDLGAEPDEAFVYWDSAGNMSALFMADESSRKIPSTAALQGIFGIKDKNGVTIDCSTSFQLYADSCEPFTVQETSRTSWVEEDALKKAISLIAGSRRISLHTWSGVEQHSNATQNLRAISCFYALTGCFDKEGGNRIFGQLPVAPISDFSLLSPDQLKLSLGCKDSPLGPSANGWITSKELYRGILDGEPYRIRALISFGGNLLLSQSDTEQATRAFENLEFHVHSDIFMNPTAEHADIVLPINTPWEREALRIGFRISTQAQEWVQLRQRMISPRHDSRSDSDIVFGLVNRMGMQGDFFGGSKESAWNAILEPLGLSTETLREMPKGVQVPIEHPTQKYKNSGFRTSSGLVELYSEILLKNNHTPLPRFKDSDILQPTSEFPYILSSAKSGYFCHSQHRQLASLRKKSRSPIIEISNVLATEHDISEQDWVEVRTRNGTARFRAKINSTLHPKVVFCEHGWWQPCTPLGVSGMPFSGPMNSNYNGLIDAVENDPISGSIPLRAFICSLKRERDQPARWMGFKNFSVSLVEPEVDGVKRIHLTPSDGEKLPEYIAGQHITIKFKLVSGVSVTRAYSLVGTAADMSHEEYVICVRNSQDKGVETPAVPSASHHINSHLVRGDIVELQAPSGSFTIPVHSGRPVILLAGGIGITPFITVLETAAIQKLTTRFLLLYGNRNSTTHVFKKKLQDLRKQLPGLSVIDVYSRPTENDVPGIDFDHTGYINTARIPEVFMNGRPLHYLCGANAMMENMTNELLALGVPLQDIFKESFTSSVDFSSVPSGAFNVTFKRSGRTEKWTNECGPLLDFAERLKLSLPSGCRVGQCESCSVNVIEGQVMHLQGHPDEDNACLTCQAIPVSDITLDA